MLRYLAFSVLLLGLVSSRAAHAQACCAGAGIVTPGRLASDERALVGLQAKIGAEYGAFDQSGHYRALSPRTSELDWEQDIYGSLRLTPHAQLAVLVPLIETRRTVAGLAETGGGIGDVNFNGRYDFTFARDSSLVPGVGLLAGVTLPSGTPPDSPRVGTLATNATGIGAYQVNLGLALEQILGPWLLNLTGAVAERSARTVTQSGVTIHSRLAPQWTLLAAAAYVFRGGAALALSAAFAAEADATVNSEEVANSGHRLTTLTFSGLLPLSYSTRLQGGLFVNPPISDLSLGEPALAGGSLTVVHVWL